MPEFFPKIKGDFKAYQKFRLRKKKLATGVLEMNPPSQQNTGMHADTCYGEVKAESGIAQCDCKLNADVLAGDHTNYSARVFADHFGKSPCLRFCPVGRVHVNRDRGKGLPDRAVPTPHFHKVDMHGMMQAYPVPKKKATGAIIGNVQSGINLFCQESRLISPDGASVVVKVNAAQLGLSIDEDPSAGIKFS